MFPFWRTLILAIKNEKLKAPQRYLHFYSFIVRDLKLFVFRLYKLTYHTLQNLCQSINFANITHSLFIDCCFVCKKYFLWAQNVLQRKNLAHKNLNFFLINLPLLSCKLFLDYISGCVFESFISVLAGFR